MAVLAAVLTAPAHAYLHKVGNIDYRGGALGQVSGDLQTFTEAANFSCIASGPNFTGVDPAWAAGKEQAIAADPFDAANTHTEFVALCSTTFGTTNGSGGAQYTYTCDAPWARFFGNSRPECWMSCPVGTTEYKSDGTVNTNPNNVVGARCLDALGYSVFGRLGPGGAVFSKQSCKFALKNPCDPATGMKFQPEPVYRGASGVFPTRYSLEYRSKRQDDPFDEWRGVHGYGWIGSFERRVKFYDPAAGPGTGSYGVKRPDGREFEFKAPASGNVYVADADVLDRLERLVDGGGAITGWKYASADGDEVEAFDAGGLLLEVANRTGARTALTYSSGTSNDTSVSRYPATAPVCSAVHPPLALGILLAARRLVCVTDPDGRQINLQYDQPTGTRIVKLIDPAGGQFQFEYDGVSGGCTTPGGSAPACSARNLTKLTYSDNQARTYHYNESANINGGAACTGLTNGLLNHLTGITDENGSRFADYTYDCLGRATSTQHAGGVEKATFAYNTDGTTTVADYVGDPAAPTVTNRKYGFQGTLGVRRTSGIVDPSNGLPAPCAGCGATASSTYDANGNVATRTDWNGNRTNYTYDLARNLEASRTEGLTSSGDPTAQTRKISTEWHSAFRLPLRTAEPLRITTYAYNGDGGVSCGFKADGVTPVPGLPCSKTVQATTDASGASGFGASASGTPRVWSYTYNTDGLMLTTDGPRTGVPDVTTYAYFPAAASCPTAGGGHASGCRGQLQSITNALGHVTSFTAYNAHGQPLGISDPNGLASTLEYDARQRLTSRTVGGEVTGLTYDNAGQLTRVTLPDASYLNYTYDAAHRLTEIADNLANRVAYTLDLMGNRTLERVYDTAGTLAQTRSRVYSSLNRLSQELGAASQMTAYAYDNQGNLTSITDPNTRLTTNAYDALHRLIRTTAPDAGQVNYAFDALDQTVGVTDPRSLVTTYVLDGLGNLNTQVSPDTGTTTNSFDAAGNVLASTDAKGQSTAYLYDALNRLTRATHAGGLIIDYAYDQGANGVGRLTSITDNTGSAAYAYDVRGRVTTETRVIAGVSFVTGYAYDSAGRMNQITYPSGRQVSYSFDALGRISGVSTTNSGNTQPVVSGVTYHPFGGVKGFSFGNGQTYARAYDQDGRIASYTEGSLTRVLGFDPASNITSISEQGLPANANAYGYDAVNRLTSYIAPAENRAYVYDTAGNRASLTVGASTYPYTYASTSNRLNQTSGPAARTYTYDPNGSVTGDGVNTFGYDTRGRMVQATTGQGATNYQVNALGQRVRKTSGADDRVFVYDSRGRLIAETDGLGNVRQEIVYLNDMPVAVIK